MREEQEGQVVADGPRVARVGMVDAGPLAVDDQGRWIRRQAREADRPASATSTTAGATPRVCRGCCGMVRGQFAFGGCARKSQVLSALVPAGDSIPGCVTAGLSTMVALGVLRPKGAGGETAVSLELPGPGR